MSLQKAFSSRILAKQFYEEWQNEVKRHVPPERLLVYEIGSGWKPLCDFLDLPLPSEEISFPTSNDTKNVEGAIRKAHMTMIGAPVICLFLSKEFLSTGMVVNGFFRRHVKNILEITMG